MICKRCGIECEGSRGPATNYLRPLCTPCSEVVDGELETLVRQSVQMQTIFDNLFPSITQEFGTIG